MKVLAMISTRNEEVYIGRILDHLKNSNISFYVIDNQSTDSTVDIVRGYAGSGLEGLETYPYPGFHDLVGLLARKEVIARTFEADWFIHQDADEILEGPERGDGLFDSIAMADEQGFNAINFDEFVFFPDSDEGDFSGVDFVKSMKDYYFHEPRKMRLIRAWKRTDNIVLANSGGHNASFPGRNIFPQNFALRHYIALSTQYADDKYRKNRSYSEVEVTQRGWHGWRAKFDQYVVRPPARADLSSIDAGEAWDRSRPFATHLFVHLRA